MRLVLINFITIRTSKHLQILRGQRPIILLRTLLNPSQQRGHYTAKIYVSTCRDIPRCKLAVYTCQRLWRNQYDSPSSLELACCYSSALHCHPWHHRLPQPWTFDLPRFTNPPPPPHKWRMFQKLGQRMKLWFWVASSSWLWSCQSFFIENHGWTHSQPERTLPVI